MIKRSIQEEDITIVNICAPNIGASKNMKQILRDLKGEIDSNTVVVGDFNTPLTSLDRSSGEKINKETLALNDLIEICRASHLKASEYILLKCAWNIHMLGHKTSLSKFKKIEMISSIFSDHNTMRLDINSKKKTVKNTNTWRLNSMLQNNQ